jgi:hypothetical protein
MIRPVTPAERKMKRRDFLLASGVALAGWRLPSRIQPIGLQL